MEVKEVVALLLFVIPGIIAEKVSYKMDFPSHEKRTDFGEIINGMWLSLPIVLIAGAITVKKNGFLTLSSLINAFDNLGFLFCFSLLVVVVAIIIGVVNGLFLGNITEHLINLIRAKTLKKMAINAKSCWRQAFLEENVSRYVEIFAGDGNEPLEEGFVEYYSLPNEEMSIVLEHYENDPRWVEHKEEIKSKLELVRTYINIEKGVTVKIYDTTKAKEYWDKLDNNCDSDS